MAIAYRPQPARIQTNVNNSATLTEETGTTADKRIVVVRTVTDDGAGSFIGTMGTVNYAGKSIVLKAVSFDRSTT